MDAIDDETFEDWVHEALDGLPEAIKAGLGPLAVIIEEEPTPEQLERLGVPGMYGLYEGVHRSRYEAELDAAAVEDHDLPRPVRAVGVDPRRRPAARAATRSATRSGTSSGSRTSDSHELAREHGGH